jgi:Fe-S-cluster containining protein
MPPSMDPSPDEPPSLAILRDALRILDEGLTHEVSAEEQRRGVRVGCHAGCTACCESSVRVRPIEIEGIVWYAATQLDEDTWRRVEARLSRPDDGVCPFLLDGQCSVRPLRPVACRSFFVFGEPCRSGERLYELRAGDVFDRSEALFERVVLRLLDDPSFGPRPDEDEPAADRTGAFYRKARRLQQVDWVATIAALRDARRCDERSRDAAVE